MESEFVSITLRAFPTENSFKVICSVNLQDMAQNHSCRVENALIDTGATHTCISQEIAELLQLNPIRSELVSLADGYVCELPVYEIEMTISLGYNLPLEVYGLPVETQATQEVLIIGMDVISMGALHIESTEDSIEGTLTFCVS